jgi:hypothetical protein
MDEVEPVTAQAQLLRARMSEARWSREVATARRRAEVVERVEKVRTERGLPWRRCLADVAPGVSWSAYLHWRRRYRNRSGPAWERLLDERVPPRTAEVPDEIRNAARMLRRSNRSINAATARQHLIAEFGRSGDVSDSSLKRIWSEAGLEYESPPGAKRVPGEETVHYNGGAGLALVAAADSELGASRKLSQAALKAARRTAEAQQEVEPWGIGEDERNELGQFTASYNEAWREGVEPGHADRRWISDVEKRRHRDLQGLALLGHRPETLASKLLCMGVIPVLTERRGFEGLGGPAGQWLEVFGGTAYMPATLEKSLTELSLLDVGAALWATHASQWHEISRRWTEAGPAWLRWAAYVDATQDPYWTRHYAASGKVSRVGRVMPCLTRVALASGPGVPLLVETHAGSASLKTKLLGMLARLDAQLGEHEVGRLTIVDAEACNAGLLWTLDDDGRNFITVLKGTVLKGAERFGYGDWLPYRQRDELRELQVLLRGKGAPKSGIQLRAVEMRRPDSRHPQSTIFVTNSGLDLLPTGDVPTAYLSRWPHQEQLFRNGRNGGGLNRSHGYGGEYVTHVALETKLEQAERHVSRAQRDLFNAEARVVDLAAAAVESKERPTPLESEAVKLAEKEMRRAEKTLDNARVEQDKLLSTPRVIYVRDTNRDNIMTCLKLTAMLLIEFVLKEYFEGLRMEWRTFIEEFNLLPVTVRSSANRVLHQIHTNPRNPRQMAFLEAACDEINRRNIRRGRRVLRYEVIPPPEPGS